MKKSVLAICIASVFIFAACKKYEDGGNNASASRHLIGVWKYESMYVDYEKLPADTFKNYYQNSTIEFKKGSEVVFTYKNIKGIVDTAYSGSYLFNDDKSRLLIAFPANLKRNNEEYLIKKLTSKNFFFEIMSGNTLYRFEMKQ